MSTGGQTLSASQVARQLVELESALVVCTSPYFGYEIVNQKIQLLSKAFALMHVDEHCFDIYNRARSIIDAAIEKFKTTGRFRDPDKE